MNLKSKLDWLVGVGDEEQCYGKQMSSDQRAAHTARTAVANVAQQQPNATR